MEDIYRYAAGISSALISFAYIHLLVRSNLDVSPGKTMRLVIGFIFNVYFVICAIKNQEPEYFIVFCWFLIVLYMLYERRKIKKVQ